jgi:hypothetical protein
VSGGVFRLKRLPALGDPAKSEAKPDLLPGKSEAGKPGLLHERLHGRRQKQEARPKGTCRQLMVAPPAVALSRVLSLRFSVPCAAASAETAERAR